MKAPLQQKMHSQLKDQFKTVDPEMYVTERNNSKRKEFLTPYTTQQLREKSAICYLSDNKVGFALLPDGDIIGVFNNSEQPGVGVEAVILAIAEGGKTLDCVGEWLVNHYKRFGFVEKKRMEWDDDQAPCGWDYDTYGRPNIVFFEYPDGLGREPIDVSRRFELARNR